MKRNTVFNNIARGLDRLKTQLSGPRQSDLDEREEDGNSGEYQSEQSSREQGTEQGLTGNDSRPRLDPSDFYSVDLGKRAQLEVYQTLWLQDLIDRLLPTENSEEETGDSRSPAPSSNETDEESTRRLMSMLYAGFSNLAAEFNKLVTGFSRLSHLRVSVTDVSDVRETVEGDKNSENAKNGKNVTFIRSRASNSAWSLSIRGQPGKIEFFLVPAPEVLLLSRSETSIRLKAVLSLNRNLESDVWMADGLTADPDELFYISRSLFKSLILATSTSADGENFVSSRILDSLEGEALRDTVKQIKLTEQNMAQKIVSQQEEIQNRIARDLHDAVIADIMSLKRSIASDKKMTDEVLASSLDQVCQRLREICHDLAPRDLKDWGLQTVIDDLVERLAQRTGADCSFIFEGEMPDLPYQVQLHIYRILQESLNNIEKYAQASRIIVQLEANAHNVKLTLRDNGRGFVNEGDPRSKREGGTGLSGIKERTEMIRCFFPARLLVVSKPGKGSVTTLEVRV